MAVTISMNKNELLLLAGEYFSSFSIELADDPKNSVLYSETNQDITQELFSFVNDLLKLHGVRTDSPPDRSDGVALVSRE